MSPDAFPQDRPVADAWAERVERMDPADLRQLAASLPTIEQAKGIVMGHYGCDATTAFAILQRWSSAYRLKLREVAAALVDEAAHDAGDGSSATTVERFLAAHRRP